MNQLFLCYTCINYRKGSGDVGVRYCSLKYFDEANNSLKPRLDHNLMVIRPDKCVGYRRNDGSKM